MFHLIVDGEPEETCTRQVERFTNILIYRHLYHPILFIFKDAVGFAIIFLFTSKIKTFYDTFSLFEERIYYLNAFS